MKIFPNDSQLAARYAKGSAPMPAMLLGANGKSSKWRVTMLTGPIPNMGGWPFYHYKEFVPYTLVVRGYNVFVLSVMIRFLLWFISWLIHFDGYWGRFFLESKNEHLLVNYDESENTWITRRIRDHLRTTEKPDEMLGKFHWVFRGREIFLGYFTLTRIVEKDSETQA